jgi:hypothetical protein
VGTEGDVELYPHTTRGDRILIGAHLPELDNVSLTRIADVPSAGDKPAFAQFIADRLARFDQMAATPDAGLIVCAQAMVGQQAPLAKPAAAVVEDDLRDAEGLQAILARGHALVATGLTKPRSRNAAEWRIAVLLVCDPGALVCLGIPPHDGSVRGIARAMAEWLAVAAHGNSGEWNRTIARVHGRVPDAIAAWERRYLRGAAKGNSIIDRARRAVAAARAKEGAGSWYAAPISEGDWSRIREAADKSALTGARRFRFEVWTTCLLLAARTIGDYQASRGSVSRVTTEGRVWTRAPICTRWMAGWPGGSGARAAARELAYKCYLRIAIQCELAERLHLSPTTRDTRAALAVRGDHDRLPADEYLVYPVTPATAIPYSPTELIAVAGAMPHRDGRPMHPVEVQHLLRLEDAKVDWQTAYGRSTGRRYREAARVARGLLFAHRAAATTRESRARGRSVA